MAQGRRQAHLNSTLHYFAACRLIDAVLKFGGRLSFRLTTYAIADLVKNSLRLFPTAQWKPVHRRILTTVMGQPWRCPDHCE
jgi:hypothetical protein